MIRFRRQWPFLAAACLLLAPVSAAGPTPPPGAEPPLLDLPGADDDPARIDYARLPVLEGEHVIVSPPDAKLKFQLHNYLLHHDGKFWCMWSQGPPVEDEPTQEVRYSTSADGVKWSAPRTLLAPDDDHHGCIARGFWLRDGELLALVAHFKGKGAFGADKELQLRAMRWEADAGKWVPKGVVYGNAINNFPPKKLPSGDWMMSRRDSRFNVSMLIGGREAIDRWEAFPVVGRREVEGFSPDEPIWWAQADGRLVGLYRDNGGSQRLFRSFSSDGGKTWTAPRKTNFPNATSKVFSLETSLGERVLLANANPAVGRREPHLALSRDGRTFDRLARLAVPSARPATLQYPHAVEHDGHLWVAFSRNKASIELLKVPLKALAALREGEGVPVRGE